MWKFWQARSWQNVLMLCCYVTTYTSRTHISAGHAFLIQKGLITAQHFGAMSAITYASLLVVKIASGFILDYFSRPKYSFLISALFCAGLTYLNTVWYTPVAFTVLYALIKCGVTFHRVSILKTLRYHYEGEHFGFIASCLQAVSCIGEAGSKFLLGILLFHVSWQQSWIICATITMIGVLMYALTIENVLITRGPDEDNGRPFFQQNIKPVIYNRSFWLLSFTNAISTIMREIMMTLSPQLFTTVFKISGEKATMLQSFTAIPAIVCLMGGGAFVDRFCKGDGIPFATLSLFFATWAMAILYFCVKLDCISLPAYYTIYLIFQGLIVTPIAFLDGLFVVQLFPKASIAMGSAWVSSVGYLGAICTSIIGRHYTSTISGWHQLLLAALLAMILQLAMMLVLNYGMPHFMLENVQDKDMEMKGDNRKHLIYCENHTYKNIIKKCDHEGLSIEDRITRTKS